MGSELLVRSEYLRDDEVRSFYVNLPGDTEIISRLQDRSPTVLIGSRGVGKSMLMRIAQSQMSLRIADDRVMPAYLSFSKAPIVHGQAKEQFSAWMVAKICNRIMQTATGYGLSLPSGTAIALVDQKKSARRYKLAEIESVLESAWKAKPSGKQDFTVPEPDELLLAVEEFCKSTGLQRLVLLVDEAAHVFIPEQQRQFFTLMRDLRSPYLAVKAAVYPGATAFGPSFQPAHDAVVVTIDRSVADRDYCSAMKEIVVRQDPSLEKKIGELHSEFETLAYAATGNPRLLLKTLMRSMPFGKKRVEDTIRDFYRDQIWSNHSELAEKFQGHKSLIDWGRQFMQSDVLPRLQGINNRSADRSSFLWIHRDAPRAVHAAMQLLCYSGVLTEGVHGTSAGNLLDGVGTRFTVNFGCHFALSDNPVAYCQDVTKSLRHNRMVQFGANHAAYKDTQTIRLDKLDSGNLALKARLSAPSASLELTKFQHDKLKLLNLQTIGDVLAAEEALFKTARGIGPVKARQLRNTAIAAVVEYLSG